MSRVYAVGSGSQWDHRRNTSETRPGEGTAQAALAALARFRAQNPEHAAWIEQGYPTLTNAEHVARFGVPYEGRRR